jgi:hypothetical protein
VPCSPRPELRALWKTAATASWTVDTQTRRLLSPSQVLAQRTALRAELTARLAMLEKKADAAWEPQYLDMLVQNGSGEGILAFDIRQQQDDCFAISTTGSRKNQWTSGLNWCLAETLNADFVDVLDAKFPAIKKLLVGQPAGDVTTKKPAKPKAKSRR